MEILGSPQSVSERVVAFVYWVGMLLMAGLLVDRWFGDDMGMTPAPTVDSLE